MKIYTASQLHWLDQYTVENEPIRSIDLMERAASNLVDQLFYNGLYKEPYAVFCGTGNNGGDGFGYELCSSNFRWLSIRFCKYNLC